MWNKNLCGADERMDLEDPLLSWFSDRSGNDCFRLLLTLDFGVGSRHCAIGRPDLVPALENDEAGDLREELLPFAGLPSWDSVGTPPPMETTGADRLYKPKAAADTFEYGISRPHVLLNAIRIRHNARNTADDPIMPPGARRRILNVERRRRKQSADVAHLLRFKLPLDLCGYTRRRPAALSEFPLVIGWRLPLKKRRDCHFPGVFRRPRLVAANRGGYAPRFPNKLHPHALHAPAVQEIFWQRIGCQLVHGLLDLQ
ncbi:MAG: hypothetical protein BJ554DRAFT_4240 [Olpidium bornovanus]|uniref:Uncharacterized protein n=1 Tax=Olpidium bornovanus TaxID=278681 RepID=A0A8H7ZMY7_9FUNG|nr:MAG: hypothetical protein BJ554DRAFT_4240 [Olpidium bornovanus]